jgi:hypothetical protein
VPTPSSTVAAVESTPPRVSSPPREVEPVADPADAEGTSSPPQAPTDAATMTEPNRPSSKRRMLDFPSLQPRPERGTPLDPTSFLYEIFVLHNSDRIVDGRSKQSRAADCAVIADFCDLRLSGPGRRSLLEHLQNKY